MMRKKDGFIHLTLVFLVVTTAILVILFLGVFKRIDKKDNTPNPLINPSITNTEPKATVAISKTDSWKIPDLPSGFNWQSKSLEQNDATKYGMFWESTSGDNSYGVIPFSTTVYSTDLNYNNPKDVLDTNDFINKFGKEMDNNGWTYEVDYGNKRIVGIAADGVFSSIYGLVKIKNNQIRSVGYSYNLHPNSWEGPGSEIVCPCQLHLEIFIGNEVNMKDI